MRVTLFALALAAAPGSALAQQPGVAVPGAEAAAPSADPRVNQVIVYGDDPCPASTNEEITVCARLPDSDRYRIPPNLRDNPNEPASRSWAGRAMELQYVGRSGTDSCSTAGAGGFTGCLSQMINLARAERRATGTDVNWTRMVEEARAEREARLRAATQEEEEDERGQTPPPN
ncbi:MAG: hypothetical protein E6G92_13495 [Alphaproteobacteria bacterium]|nr:MAG: hypothetical protein E6G92_13495 [Alphaproteobacteria bacterium]